MADDDLLGRKAAAAYLQKKGCRTSVGTLGNLAANGNAEGGPPFIRYRRKGRNYVSYRRSELDAWAAKKLKVVE